MNGTSVQERGCASAGAGGRGVGLRSRRAFTLIEAVVIVLVLAIVLPTTLVWLDEANRRRADSVSATRATALATCVMEHVLADVASKNASLGFAALANSNAYLNTGGTGLVARLSAFVSTYTAMGFSYSVNIGALVDKTGVATGNPGLDVYRVVSIGVTYQGADGSPLTVNMQSLVTSE